MVNENDRRPLASRDTGWANKLTQMLAKTSITPNQISIASMGAALTAGVLFYLAGQTSGGLRIAALLGGGLFCQLRLICNLLDGMVAVEAGKGSPDGPFWNEMPDRVSDILILVGIGYGLDMPTLGWAAAAFAVLTAYVRELGHATGLAVDFCGPMAKPQRMAVVTLAAVLAAIATLWGYSALVMQIALWVVTIGAAATALRRSARMVTQLNQPKA
ncbi:CDP-alcohol phosphatidyltransferase family protein [Profundibacter sp.]|uniref:CDP-alcohol phosphatidyltransferase family protein n=1 Tax=Profundibacter sp. TaxID=3101071 RepID=UPI003D0AC163